MDAKIIAGILAAGGAALAAGGVYRMNKKTGYFKKGNSVRYDVSRIPFKKTSPLKGKTVVFLGSSVTKGFAAHNNAFAEYIAKKDSCICIKEAVNGTTLIDNCEDSYIERMRDNLDPERQVDLFICQLSTNDATRNSPLGEISESRDLDSFDVKTVCGAIEYIIAYAKETWIGSWRYSFRFSGEMLLIRSSFQKSITPICHFSWIFRSASTIFAYVSESYCGLV